MSIYAYVGLPGSGKSYSVVANQIVPALKAGRTVVTNIPLHLDRIRRDFAVDDAQVREFPVEKIAAEPDIIEEYCKPGDLVVIDEAWRLFPSGQKVNHVPEQYKSLLAEHRHRVDDKGRAMQIVLVTQDLAQVGAFARQLVEQTFVHTKLGFLGAAGSYKCEIFNKSVTGPNPPQSLKLRTILGKYSPNVYAYYKSHTMSESATDGADESTIDTRANIWKRPIIWVAGAFCLIALPVSVHAITGFFSPQEASGKSGTAAGGASVATAAAASHLRPLERGGVPSSAPQYRVSMVIQASRADMSYALLVDDRGERIWIPAEQCMFQRMQWRCRHLNKWWVEGPTAAPRPDVRPVFSAPLVGVDGNI